MANPISFLSDALSYQTDAYLDGDAMTSRGSSKFTFSQFNQPNRTKHTKEETNVDASNMINLLQQEDKAVSYGFAPDNIEVLKRRTCFLSAKTKSLASLTTASKK